MVENFWLRARKLLYPHCHWDEEETGKVLNFIWETVYVKFQGSWNWEALHQINLRRLEMVHRWVRRKPGRWLPIPEIYFDPLNQSNGFNRTWKWYRKAEHLKKRMKEQKLVADMHTQWQKLDQGALSSSALQLLFKQKDNLAGQSEKMQQAYLHMLRKRITHYPNGIRGR
jgi:hypothetical protein